MPIDSQPDYYGILNLPPESSIQEIRRQYRRLAKIYHPDRNPGEEEWCVEQVKKLNTAYQFLSNPELKSKYDRELKKSAQSTGPHVPGSPDWNVVGDGRSVYTRWRPDGSEKPPPKPRRVVAASKSVVKTRRWQPSEGVALGMAVLAGIAAIISYKVWVVPYLSPPPSPITLIQHRVVAAPPLLVHTTVGAGVVRHRRERHARPLIKAHPTEKTVVYSTAGMTPDEKDQLAEHLAEQAELAKHHAGQ